MEKIIFTFTKQGAMKYISHLDLMRLFMRALRRAALPIKFSEGFSPHPKFSIKRALKLGVESESEEASVMLTKNVDSVYFQQALNNSLPKGIRIKDAKRDIN